MKRALAIGSVVAWSAALVLAFGAGQSSVSGESESAMEASPSEARARMRADPPIAAASPASVGHPGADAVRYEFDDALGNISADFDYDDFRVDVQSRRVAVGSGAHELRIKYTPIQRVTSRLHGLRHRIRFEGRAVGQIRCADWEQPERISGTGEVDFYVYSDTRDAFDRGGVQPRSCELTLRVETVGRSGDAFDQLDTEDLYLVLPFDPRPNEIHLPKYAGAFEWRTRNTKQGLQSIATPLARTRTSP